MESEESKIICKGCKESVDKVSILMHLSNTTKKGCKNSYTSEELDAFQNKATLRRKQKKLEVLQIKRSTDNQSSDTDTRVICKVCHKPFPPPVRVSVITTISIDIFIMVTHLHYHDHLISGKARASNGWYSAGT